MQVSRLIWLMLVLWLAIYVWSIWILTTLPPEGDGFTRGLNRLVGFMKWQMAAGAIALAIWAMGRRFAAGTPARWISRAPGLLALLPVLAIVSLITYAQMSKFTASQVPAPAAPPKPVTAPVD